MSFEVKKD